MKPAIVFLAICVMGFFCAWIGGVRPFTAGAVFSSIMTLILACGFAGFVYGVEDMK